MAETDRRQQSYIRREAALELKAKQLQVGGIGGDIGWGIRCKMNLELKAQQLQVGGRRGIGVMGDKG